MAKFFPMFSGSDGNSTYIGGASGGLIVDVGVSYKRIKQALENAEINLSTIKAVLITHQHTDHIKGLKVFLKNNPVPVVASRETIYALEFQGIINSEYPRVYIDELESVQFEDMVVKSVPTSHDAKGSCCFTVSLGQDQKVAVCTDLGVMSEEIMNELAGSALVMLESNHDPVMLRLGPYTAELKLRIASKEGHLPNAVCAESIAKLFCLGTNRFVLAHLSEQNNTPEKAASATRAALMDKGAKENIDYILYIAEKEGKRIITV
ncbi:MAG: MBL fold metallo-hydrolase [Clostridia bacterium]|nr:MBL fold metallo-hydrolase [Clostridia bacterium]